MEHYSFPQQSAFYQGKVRDVYTIDNTYLVMIASDRISAFDVILPRTIPCKGQVLNQLSAFMLERTRDICPNWLINTPVPNASVGYKCQPFKVEVVVRGHLCGHAWRTYNNGARTLCGAKLPEGLSENDPFPEPLITPSTKADHGHDEDIRPEDIIAGGLATPEQWDEICRMALGLFERGRQMASGRGLILVDTKYEFGSRGDTIVLMDEIHTPDSSRYFYAEGFEERQAKGEKQKQLSKEFVREWLIANDFMGQPGQTIPEMSDEWVKTISDRYIELFEKVTGETFVPFKSETEETYRLVNDAVNRLLHDRN